MTPVHTLQLCTLGRFLRKMSNVIPMSAAKLLIPMASAAPLFMACNSASHDDNTTDLCVELHCLTTTNIVDTTPPAPDVLLLLDLQTADSESVCTVRVVSNASNWNSGCPLGFSGPLTYFAILPILRWSLFVDLDMTRDNFLCTLSMHKYLPLAASARNDLISSGSINSGSFSVSFASSLTC